MDPPEEQVAPAEVAEDAEDAEAIAQQQKADAETIAKPTDLSPVATAWFKGQKKHLEFKSYAGATPENEVREKVARFLASKLWTWEKFDPILPATVFTQSGLTIGVSNPFDVDSSSENEKEKISLEDGKPKRLTPEQYKQVWDSGRFDVPSINSPGEHYTWQLSYLLIFGFKNNKELLYNRLAVAVSQLIISTRLRLFGTRPLSIVHGVKQMGGGLVDLFAALFGLPEMRPKYDPDLVERIAQSLEKQDLLKAGEIKQFKWKTPTGETVDISPFFFEGDTKYKSLRGSVQRAWSDVTAAWAQDRFGFEEKLRAQYRDQPASPALEVQIANELVEEQARRFYAALARVLGADYDASYAAAVQVYFEARRLIEQLEADRSRRVQEARAAAEADLKIRCPIRSRIPEWMERQLARAEPKLAPLLPEALFQIRQAKLGDAAVFLAHHVQYQDEKAAAVVKRLSAEEEPVGSISLGRRIWFKRNWRLMKRPVRGKPPVFYAEKWHYVTVATSHPFWRVQLFFVRVWVWWSNSLWVLGQNLLHGPLSFRALFSPRPYRPFWTVNEHTGDLERTSETIETLASRLRALWGHIGTARSKFEATPDRGFLGKSVSRLFNMFWNYVMLGLLGTVGIVTVQPTLTLANYVISIAFGVTSFAWTPLAVALHRVFQLLLVDTDRQVRGSGWAPLLGALNRFSTFGVLQVAGSLLAGVVVHPVISLLVATLASVASVTRGAYDAFMFYAAIKPRARIPAFDTFLCKMVHGPGAARTQWQHITGEEVLAGVQAALEREEMNYFRDLIAAAVNEPTRHRTALINAVFGEVGLSLGTHFSFTRSDDALNRIMDRFAKTTREREKTFPQVIGSGNLKQTAGELRDTIDSCVTLVKGFCDTHLFPLIKELRNSERLFWHNKDIKIGDWEGLAKRYMSEVFGSELLASIEETDQTYQLDVRHTDLHEFISMIKKARPHESMQVTGGSRPVRVPVAPTRVAVDASWADEVTEPRPRTHADALTPAARHDDSRQKPGDILKGILDFSEERRLNPPPGPYDPVEVPRDEVPWLRKPSSSSNNNNADN